MNVSEHTTSKPSTQLLAQKTVGSGVPYGTLKEDDRVPAARSHAKLKSRDKDTGTQLSYHDVSYSVIISKCCRQSIEKKILRDVRFVFHCFVILSVFVIENNE